MSEKLNPKEFKKMLDEHFVECVKAEKTAAPGNAKTIFGLLGKLNRMLKIATTVPLDDSVNEAGKPSKPVETAKEGEGPDNDAEGLKDLVKDIGKGISDEVSKGLQSFFASLKSEVQPADKNKNGKAEILE